MAARPPCCRPCAGRRRAPAPSCCSATIPALGALAHALAGGEVPGGAGSRFLKFPTAGLAVFAVADRNWAGIGIGDMSIRRFVDARSLPD